MVLFLLGLVFVSNFGQEEVQVQDVLHDLEAVQTQEVEDLLLVGFQVEFVLEQPVEVAVALAVLESRDFFTCHGHELVQEVFVFLDVESMVSVSLFRLIRQRVLEIHDLLLALLVRAILDFVLVPLDPGLDHLEDVVQLFVQNCRVVEFLHDFLPKFVVQNRRQETLDEMQLIENHEDVVAVVDRPHDQVEPSRIHSHL